MRSIIENLISPDYHFVFCYIPRALDITVEKMKILKLTRKEVAVPLISVVLKIFGGQLKSFDFFGNFKFFGGYQYWAWLSPHKRKSTPKTHITSTLMLKVRTDSFVYLPIKPERLTNSYQNTNTFFLKQSKF